MKGKIKMIALRNDCLIIQDENGVGTPQTVEKFTLQILGDIDMEVVKEASAVVVYYFRHEVRREIVSIEEFIFILKRVLNNLGYDISDVSIEVFPTPGVDDFAGDPLKN